MTIIILATAAAAVLAAQWGPGGSVGGALSVGLVILCGMVAVAIHDAWSHRRGVLGYVVNVMAALAGGLLAASVIELPLVLLLALLGFDGAIASSRHPLGPVVMGAAAAALVGSAWLPIRLINRWRGRSALAR